MTGPYGAPAGRQVISFDVFDTCLARTVADPNDVFILTARAILQATGREPDRTSEIELARARRDADRKARRNSDREDIPLDEIYRVARLERWGISPTEMMREELRVERASVRPIASVRSRIDEIHAKGESVVFISDTPLPHDHVRDVLRDSGFFVPGDRLYTSGETGLTKTSGNLFKHVLENERMSADNWTHSGDNPKGDVAVPQSLGISVAPFHEGDLTTRERKLADDANLDSVARSRLAGTSRVVRLSTTDPQEATTTIAASIIAPLLTVFVAWVLRDAQSQGLTRLYFVSRDGELLLDIAWILSKSMPSPECSYLYGSRRAWLIPSIEGKDDIDDRFPGGTDELGTLIHELAGDETARKALVNAGLHPRDANQPLDRRDVKTFRKTLESPHVASLVSELGHEARVDTQAYLTQEGLTASDDWALVDIGWKLRSQLALNRILEGHKVQGYYLAAASTRHPVADTGPYRALFLEEDYTEITEIRRRALLVETVFCPSSHGTVMGYTVEGEKSVPILSADGADATFLEHRATVRQMVLAFTEEAMRNGLFESDLRALADSALATAHDFIMAPTNGEARSLAGLAAYDPLLGRSRPFVDPIGWSDVGSTFIASLPRLKIARRFRHRPGRPLWEEGSLAVSSLWMRAMHRAARFPSIRPAGRS